jgi:hypothetical protein
MSPCCDLCGKMFTRPNHLARHRNTAACTRLRLQTRRRPAAAEDEVTSSSARRPAGAKKVRKPAAAPRGLAGSGNMRRKIGFGVGSLIQRLKQNVVLARSTASFGIVNFVPYDSAYTAKDIAAIAAVFKKQRRWSSQKNRPRLLAGTLAAMHFFTVKGAAAVTLPAIPWTRVYEQTLRDNLWRSREEPLYNTGNMYTKSLSFRGMDPVAQMAKIGAVVDVVKECCRVAAYAIEQIRARKNNPALADRSDLFYNDIAHFGMPAGSYGQNLAKCVWTYGLRLGGEVEGIFPDEPKNSTLLSSQQGTCKGIAQLTGDASEVLVKEKELQRLRIDLIAKEVKAKWSKVGPRVADPYGKKTSADRSRALAHQLCEWAKADFAIDVDAPKTMAAA